MAVVIGFSGAGFVENHTQSRVYFSEWSVGREAVDGL